MIYSEIKRILKERGLSIDWLAKQAGISPSTLYSRFAKGGDKIDMALILKTCELLEIPVEHFLGDIGQSMSAPSFEEWELINAYRRLDKHGKELVAMVLGKEEQRIKGETT